MLVGLAEKSIHHDLVHLNDFVRLEDNGPAADLLGAPWPGH